MGRSMMICEKCKECMNYMVSEVGCYGDVKPCEYLRVDDQDEYLLTTASDERIHISKECGMKNIWDTI